ncbi:hypothetical protein LPJ63_000366 [Coemansia sp. RSA 2711]|nr:hypothetical protein LPJ63_000366 [Coemansia sp. RSA 2711]KAJ2323792.1 hypothetical protein IWW51_003588 [Coemansia sp. RSA 2702]
MLITRRVSPGQRIITGRRIITRQCIATNRRALATGVVFVSRLPEQAGESVLAEVAAHHAHVYGTWSKQRGPPGRPAPLPIGPPHSNGYMAAVRITTGPVPQDLDAIAQLPEPTNDEIEQCRAAMLAVVDELRQRGISAMPVSKHPGMFQSAARQALGLGSSTRQFDQRTTPTPKYTRGLIDGYRQGFIEAQRQNDIADLLRQCEECDDELKFMAEYFEHSAGL